MKRVSRTVPAPSDLGIDVLGVPEGSDVALELRLESVVEGVLVSGSARSVVSGECVRCLDPLRRDLETDLQELYAYPDVERAPDDDAEESRLEGDFLDLEPVLRDAVVLALPLAPVCREDCAGLCPECGARLADDPGHAHDRLDDRWAALAGLTAGGDAPDSTFDLEAGSEPHTEPHDPPHDRPQTDRGTSPATRQES